MQNGKGGGSCLLPRLKIECKSLNHCVCCICTKEMRKKTQLSKMLSFVLHLILPLLKIALYPSMYFYQEKCLKRSNTWYPIKLAVWLGLRA